MLSDPLVLTLPTAGAKSLPRVANPTTEKPTSVYQNADDTFHVEVSHQASGKDRVRHRVQAIQRKVVTDPLSSKVDDTDSIDIQVIFGRPLYGFSVAELNDLWAGLKTKIDLAILTQIYGRES